MKRRTKETLKSVGLLFPSLAAVFVFVYVFIAQTLQLSFLNWNDFTALLTGTRKYVGFANYIALFGDQRFQSDLWNTLFFTLFFLCGCLTIGILLAVLIDRGAKGSYLLQNIFLFPMALAFVVTGTVWRWIFAPGLPNDPQGINQLLTKMGLGFLKWQWFTSTQTVGPFNLALIPLIIAAVWQFSGYTMVMWLAGLRGISEDIIEAAKVDGASGVGIFWNIQFPLLTPITLSAAIVLGHISLKIFDLVYAMTGSGPGNVTDMPSVYMFEATFRSNRYSTGAGIAIFMLLMVSVVIIPYLVAGFKKETR